MKELWTTLTGAAALVTHARGGFIAAAVLIFIASVPIVGFRWRLILRALGCRVSVWDTMLTYEAGVCLSNVTPARILGADAFRLAVIRSRAHASARIAAASILYDRGSEAPAITILSLLTLYRLPRYSWMAAAFVVIVSGVLLLRPIRRAVMSRVAGWHETLIGERVRSGSVATAIGWSMLLYLQDVTRIFLIAAAFNVWLTPAQAATMSVIRLLGGATPLPGGVGVVEGSQVGALVLFGIPTETAAAITLVERAILYVFGTAIGAVALMLLGGRRVISQSVHADA